MNNATPTLTATSMERPPELDGEILTVPEVARFLRVPKSTVYKLARIGDIPASKIGKHWRFLRRDVQSWVCTRAHHTPGH